MQVVAVSAGRGQDLTPEKTDAVELSQDLELSGFPNFTQPGRNSME